MSNDITEKQHYVWRHYLEAWKETKEEKEIWTGYLQTKEVKKSALKSVAQTRYFYKLEVLSELEIASLIQYRNLLPSHIQRIADIIIAGYAEFSHTKRGIAAGTIIMNEELEHKLKKKESSSFESIQSSIENQGRDLLKCKSLYDVQRLITHSVYDVLLYLMVQYTRTKALKEKFITYYSDKPHLKEVGRKTWPFWNIVTALQLISGIITKPYRFIFVNNLSNIPFTTGDQPVINALGDLKDEKGDVKELELYYPLSPTSAILIAFDNGDPFSEISVDETYAKNRNAMITKESLIHIFANNESVLRSLI